MYCIHFVLHTYMYTPSYITFNFHYEERQNKVDWVCILCVRVCTFFRRRRRRNEQPVPFDILLFFHKCGFGLLFFSLFNWMRVPWPKSRKIIIVFLFTWPFSHCCYCCCSTWIYPEKRTKKEKETQRPKIKWFFSHEMRPDTTNRMPFFKWKYSFKCSYRTEF